MCLNILTDFCFDTVVSGTQNLFLLGNFSVFRKISYNYLLLSNPREKVQVKQLAIEPR